MIKLTKQQYGQLQMFRGGLLMIQIYLMIMVSWLSGALVMLILLTLPFFFEKKHDVLEKVKKMSKCKKPNSFISDEHIWIWNKDKKNYECEVCGEEQNGK